MENGREYDQSLLLSLIENGNDVENYKVLYSLRFPKFNLIVHHIKDDFPRLIWAFKY